MHTHTHTLGLHFQLLANHCAATARLLSDTVKCLAYALMLTERQGVRWALSKCKVCLSARISSVFSPYHTHIHSPLSSLALSLSALDKSQAYVVAATNVALSSCEWAQRSDNNNNRNSRKKGKTTITTATTTTALDLINAAPNELWACPATDAAVATLAQDARHASELINHKNTYLSPQIHTQTYAYVCVYLCMPAHIHRYISLHSKCKALRQLTLTLPRGLTLPKNKLQKTKDKQK